AALAGGPRLRSSRFYDTHDPEALRGARRSAYRYGRGAGFAGTIAGTRRQRRSRGPRRRALAAALSQDGRRSVTGDAFARQVQHKEATDEDAAPGSGELS